MHNTCFVTDIILFRQRTEMSLTHGLISAGTIWYVVPSLILEVVRRTGRSCCHNGGTCASCALDIVKMSNKYQIAVHQMRFSNSKCTKTRFWLGLHPGPCWEAYNAPPEPQVGWGGYPLPILLSPLHLQHLD